MKEQMLRLVLAVLALTPFASVATAAQNKLQTLDDMKLVNQTRSGSESDITVNALQLRGLIETKVHEMEPPAPSRIH